jgi:hypothetical protein
MTAHDATPILAMNQEQTFALSQNNNKQTRHRHMTPHTPLFQDGRTLHRYVDERGGCVLAWGGTPLFLRMTARINMVSTDTGMRRALIVPKSAMSGEDKMALRRWQQQRRDTFQRINGRG